MLSFGIGGVGANTSDVSDEKNSTDNPVFNKQRKKRVNYWIPQISLLRTNLPCFVPIEWLFSFIQGQTDNNYLLNCILWNSEWILFHFPSNSQLVWFKLNFYGRGSEQRLVLFATQCFSFTFCHNYNHWELQIFRNVCIAFVWLISVV